MFNLYLSLFLLIQINSIYDGVTVNFKESFEALPLLLQ